MSAVGCFHKRQLGLLSCLLGHHLSRCSQLAEAAGRIKVWEPAVPHSPQVSVGIITSRSFPVLIFTV